MDRKSPSCLASSCGRALNILKRSDIGRGGVSGSSPSENSLLHYN